MSAVVVILAQLAILFIVLGGILIMLRRSRPAMRLLALGTVLVVLSVVLARLTPLQSAAVGAVSALVALVSFRGVSVSRGRLGAPILAAIGLMMLFAIPALVEAVNFGVQYVHAHRVLAGVMIAAAVGVLTAILLAKIGRRSRDQVPASRYRRRLAPERHVPPRPNSHRAHRFETTSKGGSHVA